MKLHVADYPVNKNSFFFPTIWEILKKKLDSLIALTICTKQTFPICQTQQSATPTTSSPGRYSISLRLHRGKPASSQGQNITWVQKCTGIRAQKQIISEANLKFRQSSLPFFCLRVNTGWTVQQRNAPA